MSAHDAQSLLERLASRASCACCQREHVAAFPCPWCSFEALAAERRACNAAAIRAAGYGCHALAAEQLAGERQARTLRIVLALAWVEARAPLSLPARRPGRERA